MVHLYSTLNKLRTELSNKFSIGVKCESIETPPSCLWPPAGGSVTGLSSGPSSTMYTPTFTWLLQPQQELGQPCKQVLGSSQNRLAATHQCLLLLRCQSQGGRAALSAAQALFGISTSGHAGREGPGLGNARPALRLTSSWLSRERSPAVIFGKELVNTRARTRQASESVLASQELQAQLRGEPCSLHTAEGLLMLAGLPRHSPGPAGCAAFGSNMLLLSSL